MRIPSQWDNNREGCETVKKIIIWLVIFTLSLPTVTFGATTSEQQKRPLMLHIENNKVVNELGQTVRLTGANVPSMQWSNGEKNLEESIAMTFDNWNANILRLCLTQKFWYGKEWYISDGGASYRKRVEGIVNMAASRGKYILIDLHEFGFPDENSPMFWRDIVAMYKNNPAVLFDILNEPHDTSWDFWRNGGEYKGSDGKTHKSVGLQGLVNAIRENGAKNIIVAGGLDWAYDLRGIQKGYDGLENGYALEEPQGKLKGNGIMYGAHIYPLKQGDQDDWADKVGCIINDYPVLVGETGHFGDRVADWYDARGGADSVIWMNEVLNYMDIHNLSYTAWDMHTSSSPCMISDWDYKPTPYYGVIMKFNMLSQPDTRPEVPEVKDKYPLYTWKKTVDFDNVAPKWEVYKKDNAGYFAAGETEGLTGKGELIAFDTPASSAGAIADLPKDWNLAGTNEIWFKIKSDGDIRKVGAGFELNDGRQFKVVFPINLYKEWQTMYFPLACLKGEYGVIDTTQIRSVFFTSESDGAGSFTIDDFTIAGGEYSKPGLFEVTDHFDSDSAVGSSITWDAWSDTESTEDIVRNDFHPDDFGGTQSDIISTGEDSFTTKWVKSGGHDGSGGRQSWFIRPKGSYGGQTRGIFPLNWNLQAATYMSFWIKGSGDLDLLLRLEKNTQKPQKVMFYRRELERFCIPVKVKGTDWQKVTLKIADFGMSEDFEMEKINALSIFNMTEGGKGNFILDDLTFTNKAPGLEDKYSTHPEPQPSEKVEVLPQKYKDSAVLQVPRQKEYVFKAGKEASLNFEIHNKTDKKVSGLLTVDQVPVGFDLGQYGGFVRYSLQAREKVNKSISFTPPTGTHGQYKITVIDTNEQGALPQEYLITVEP